MIYIKCTYYILMGIHTKEHHFWMTNYFYNFLKVPLFPTSMEAFTYEANPQEY